MFPPRPRGLKFSCALSKLFVAPPGIVLCCFTCIPTLFCLVFGFSLPQWEILFNFQAVDPWTTIPSRKDAYPTLKSRNMLRNPWRVADERDIRIYLFTIVLYSMFFC